MTRRNISDLKESLQFTQEDIDENINGFNQKVKEIEIDLNEIKKTIISEWMVSVKTGKKVRMIASTKCTRFQKTILKRALMIQ